MSDARRQALLRRKALLERKAELEAQETGGLEATLRGVAEGAIAGFWDEGAGLVGAAGETVTGLFDDEDEKMAFMDLYRKHRDESRAAQKQAQEQHPGKFTSGEILGTGASLLIPGGAAAKGTQLLAKGGQALARKLPSTVSKIAGAGGKATAGGAAAGLGGSEADLTKGEFTEAAKDTATGAALGYGLGTGSKLLGKGVKKAKEGLQDTAKKLRLDKVGFSKLDKEGLKPEGREEMAEFIAKHDLLKTTPEETLAAATKLRKEIGAKYDEFAEKYLDGEPIQIDPLRTARQMNNQLRKKATSDVETKTQKALLRQTIKKLLQAKKNQDPEQLQMIKNSIRKTANPKKDPTTDSGLAKQRLAQDMYQTILKEERRELASQLGDPKMAAKALQEYNAINKDYSFAKQAEQAASGSAAGEKLGSLITLGGATVGGQLAYQYDIPWLASLFGGVAAASLTKRYGPQAVSRIAKSIKSGSPTGQKIKKLMEAGKIDEVASIVGARNLTGE